MMRKTSVILLSAATGAALTLFVTQPRAVLMGSSARAATSDTYRQLNLFGDVFERVRSDYVEKPDDSKLVESAISGMLTGLDPHSSYMDAKSLRDNIRVRSVRARTEGDDIGYIRITTFNEQTTEGLKREIGNLTTQLGDKLKGFVIDPRPQRRGNPAPRRASGRSDQRQAGDRSDQRRFGIGIGNRRWRVAGSQACHAGRHALVRQGLGANHHSAGFRQWRFASDYGALLHAVGQIDPGQGHRSRYRGASGRARRVEIADRHQGRSLAARPSEVRRRREDRFAVLRPAGRQGRQGLEDGGRPAARRQGQRHRARHRRQGRDRQARQQGGELIRPNYSVFERSGYRFA